MSLLTSENVSLFQQSLALSAPRCLCTVMADDVCSRNMQDRNQFQRSLVVMFSAFAWAAVKRNLIRALRHCACWGNRHPQSVKPRFLIREAQIRRTSNGTPDLTKIEDWTIRIYFK